MQPRGKVNLVALLLMGAIAAAIYSVIMFSGAYVDNFDVKTEVASLVNQANRLTDDQLRATLVSRMNQIGTHYEEQFDGSWVEQPGLGVTNDNVQINRDTVAGIIVVRVDYGRLINLKPFGKWTTLNVSAQKEGPVAQ